MMPLDLMYNNVWNQSFWIFFLWGLVVSGGIGFLAALYFAAKKNATGCLVAVVVALFSVGFHYAIARSNANARADHAVVDAWEAAKTERATFIEVLHAPWVGYGWETHTCRQTINSSPGCNYYSTRDVNCRPVCASRDDDGDCTSWREECDTQYTPWFKYEWSPWARTDIMTRLVEPPLEVDKPDLPPRVFFARHLAPQNWQDEKYCLFCVPGWANFTSEPPYDWVRIKTAIDSGRVLIGSFYHHYMNYFHVDDYSLFQVYGGDIPIYKEADVLPSINNIYSDSENAPVSYDYDFVQFLGGLQPGREDGDRWQQMASVWAGDAGPKLQASLVLFLAPAEKIPQLGADPMANWISTSKAWLMQKDVWDLRILPKNLVLIGCVVDASSGIVRECRMETGMFTGNNEVKDAVSRVRDVAFTPEGLFGAISATYGTPLDNGINPAQITRDGNGMLELLYAPQPQGFKRVSMGPFDYRMTNVEPTEEQKVTIAKSERNRTWLYVGIEFALGILVVVMGLYGISKS